MDRTQRTAIIILAAFTALAIFVAIKAQDISASMQTAKLFPNLFFVYLLNPANILLAYGIVFVHRERALKAILAAVLLVFAFTAVSFPHMVDKTGLPTTVAAYGSADTLVIKNLAVTTGHTFAWYLYYLILPILCVIGALALLGYKAFVRKINGG